MVQLASILAWGASGRPFESGCSDSLETISFTASRFFFAIKQKTASYKSIRMRKNNIKIMKKIRF